MSPTAASPPDGLSADELAAWLRLLETPGIGRATARKLLAALGSPQAIFDAPAAAWSELLGHKLAQQLAQPPAELPALIERTEEWLATTDDTPGTRAILALGDARYPARLLETPDPPLLLYACGQLERLGAPAVAVVGSRNPSAQGAENARVFACALSQAGLAVVSGLAEGIDGAAHEGALLGWGGTIAVVGTGLDRVYPRRHRDLAHQIAKQGLLLSEFPLGTAPLAPNFPQRNRIIAGLGLGTLVVEAALQSGSLITARLAAEYGREVFAIPGSIHSPQSKGCHALIKQGAKLVESTQDILEELKLAAPAQPASTESALPNGTGRRYRKTDPPPKLAPPQTEHLFAPDTDRTDKDQQILQALGFGPATLDALQARTGWSTSDLSVQLLTLELSGEVERLPGQLFQRCARA
jgi:DNA processing protein